MALPSPAEGSIALVTGASSGIGEAFARELAKRGYGLGLVARSQDKLEALSRELGAPRAEVLPCDLAEPAARDRLAAEIESRGLTVEILVNNAGFGIYDDFAESDRERCRRPRQAARGAGCAEPHQRHDGPAHAPPGAPARPTRAGRLAVVPEDVVHPGLLGG